MTTARGTARILVLGDVVLDRDVYGRTERVAPDAPVPVVDVDDIRESPGGAGLTALLCAASGADVTLVAAIAADASGDRLSGLLRSEVSLLPLGHTGATRRKTRIRSGGQSLLRVDDGGRGAPVDPPLERLESLVDGADVVLVSDYGAGTTAHPGIRDVLSWAARRTTLVWDPHPRGTSPVSGAALVTPNLAEARVAASTAGLAARSHADELAAALRTHWRARAVCVTAGSEGAYLALSADEPRYVPAPTVSGGDPCGAGDRFAAAAAVALADGAVLSEAVTTAVTEASAWVAAGGAEAFRRAQAEVTGSVREPDTALRLDVDEVVARARAGGRTVVATGGCFDLLHAGHVASLEAARRLGDVLVVLINSDESVRRLKGPGRPAVGVEDRARVLRALACVDAVGVFGEDDPRAALDRLRPDIWAKGGDYGAEPLPEAKLVRSWGGRVVLLPYVAGRSTTSLLSRASDTPSERAQS